MQRNQAGFTLVEIAIVLVIIGILLGGVLKGQELINNSKIRQVIGDMNAVQAAYYSYQDRYRVIPGDDAGANTRFPNTQVNGGGNGVITGNYETTGSTLSATTESENFWQHVRAAGFMKGPDSGAASGLPPTSALGGRIGIEDAAYGLVGPVVCTSVESQYAPSIDANLDDGVATSGDVRSAGAGSGGINAATSATAAAYAVPSGTNIYTVVCKKI